MTQKEPANMVDAGQARLQVLNSLLAEHMTLDQAATLMGSSPRHTRRILAVYRQKGVPSSPIMDWHSRYVVAWRTVKCEEVYLKAYANATEARGELGAYFRFYSNQRPRQARGYWTTAEVFPGAGNAPPEEGKVTEGPPEPVLVASAGSPMTPRAASSAAIRTPRPCRR